jgi:hypothetical protein
MCSSEQLEAWGLAAASCKSYPAVLVGDHARGTGVR